MKLMLKYAKNYFDIDTLLTFKQDRAPAHTTNVTIIFYRNKDFCQ